MWWNFTSLMMCGPGVKLEAFTSMVKMKAEEQSGKTALQDSFMFNLSSSVSLLACELKARKMKQMSLTPPV